MTAPLVSVLMTSYNREQYIAAAIDSVLAQTFGDFELLVTDNRSTDRSVEIARGYEQRDPRVRVVVNDENLGQFGNRNRAAALARGTLLKYHDSDDVMYPYCLATMVGPLMNEPRAGFALSAGWNWPGGPCPMLLTPHMCYQREFLGNGMFHAGPGGAVFRTSVFHSLGGFPDRGVASDNLFWLHACARVSVLLLPADLFWYRIHADQEYQHETAQFENARMFGENWLRLQSADCPLTPAEREQARRNRAYALARRTLQDVRRGAWRLAAHRLRHSRMTLSDWMMYLRPPRRAMLAGTPLDEHGDFVIPGAGAFEVPEPAGVVVRSNVTAPDRS